MAFNKKGRKRRNRSFYLTFHPVSSGSSDRQYLTYYPASDSQSSSFSFPLFKQCAPYLIFSILSVQFSFQERIWSNQRRAHSNSTSAHSPSANSNKRSETLELRTEERSLHLASTRELPRVSKLFQIPTFIITSGEWKAPKHRICRCWVYQIRSS